MSDFTDDVDWYDSDMLLTKTCKFCGLSGLRWETVQEGWRLVDAEDQLHECLKGNRVKKE